MRGRLSLGVVVAVALGAGPARAGIEPWFFTHEDVKAYSCRELLALDDTRQSLALTYFSGYLDGQRGRVQFDAGAKGVVVDRVLEHCRRDAAGSVLDAFARFTP